MKKYLYVLLAFTFALTSCYTYKAVPITMESVERIISVDGSQNELFIKANTWMVEIFTSSKSVIQFSDKEAGIVTGKYLFKDFGSSAGAYGQIIDHGEIFALIKIQVKDNGAKITIDAEDFTEIHSKLNESYRYTKIKAMQEIKTLMDNFENYIKTTNVNF